MFYLLQGRTQPRILGGAKSSAWKKCEAGCVVTPTPSHFLTLEVFLIHGHVCILPMGNTWACIAGLKDWMLYKFIKCYS